MYSPLKELISDKSRIKLFVGVGNVLHSDDAVGVYISERITEQDHIGVITAEVSIENYIGKINSIRADLLILIDSVFFGREPGYCSIMPVDQLVDFTTNTHNISLHRISELFTVPVWILGIQPASVSFGEQISPAVRKTADFIVNLINGG
ncbi:MAG: hydrogenase maturation protease [Bacteroidales bacterium]|nr:hydrogenase maturation protease [Bacteroidales bacterium]